MGRKRVRAAPGARCVVHPATDDAGAVACDELVEELLVGSGDEAVDRHRDGRDDPVHRSSFGECHLCRPGPGRRLIGDAKLQEWILNVRWRLKFRVKQIVYVAFSLDEAVTGFAFPKMVVPNKLSRAYDLALPDGPG